MMSYRGGGIRILVFLLALSAVEAQSTTDPVEVDALKAFANKLGIAQLWNFNVDPCSGLEGWNNTSGANSFQPALGIQCDCSMNTSLCHVQKITVVAMNAAGEIAPEIGNFPFLDSLNLAQNVITGTVPEEIGSLSRLQYLSVGINRLSGRIPTSFGKLSQLISIGIGTNYFTGTLPKEIGNLKFLTQLYMDSSGLSGEIPPEFGNLRSLETLWMADNSFNGTVPEFLGNLTSLKDLRMYGNNFRGQLPPTLGSLQNLNSLYIGDVSSGGLIPVTLNRLSKLNTLSLRNCELSGPIPELGNLTNLVLLDLSINSLSGQIPQSFGSFPSLVTLLLANNNLTGALPSQLASLSALQRLDISSNHFSGPLPSWINNVKLEANIIGNIFNATRSSGRTAQSMRCLQEGSGCDKVDDGENFQFAINCGGSQIKSSAGTVYSDDSASLSQGTFFSNSSQPWALSISGYSSDGFKTAVSTTTRVTGTPDPILYQTARSSPSSLKYYGLGMPNGRYNLLLLFSEIVILDNGTAWTGLGRRSFDVYVQGSKVLDDFNIQLEARGSFKALIKNFSAVVSRNVLEVELLWTGKGTCCSPAPESFGPLLSGIQVIPGFDTSRFIQKKEAASRSKAVGIGVGVAVGVVALIAAISAIFFLLRKQKVTGEEEEELRSLEGKPNLFSFNEMKAATQGFSHDNKLGHGGFGTVYKAVLPNGKVVAIKQLSAKSNQGTREFLNEATVISAVQHRNLVKLEGCCIEGGHRILVYEFLENNSLHQALFKSKILKSQLLWSTRFKICVGIARGIAYLHEESLPRIIHRDIKASNVLLDKDLNPKIADFGLAKLFDDRDTHVSTRVAGTIGYLAPEYAMRGHLSEKADVYSFGVLALEVVSGRENLDTSQPSDMIYLLEWAWQMYETNRPLEVVDKEIGEFDEQQALRMIQVSLLCSQAVFTSRPQMSDVVSMLLGTSRIDVSSLGPGYFTALKNAAPMFFTDGNSAHHTATATSSTSNSSVFSSKLMTDGRT